MSNPEKNTSGRSSYLKIALINLAPVIVILVLAELVFGSWFSGPGASFRQRLSVVYDATALYENGAEVVYFRDENSFRGSYQSPGSIGILSIGGSTTDQHYIPDGKTFQDVLAAHFREAGQQVSVVNAGRDGQSTVGHLRAFEEWFPGVPGLKPRYVLAYIGINDRHLDQVGRSAYDSFQNLSPLHKLKRYVAARSAFYRAWQIATGTMNARREKLGHGQTRVTSVDAATGQSLWRRLDPPPDLRDVENRLKPKLDNYEERVAQLIARIRALGAEPIIVTQSEADYRVRNGEVFGLLQPNGTIDPGDYAVMTAFNRRAMKACSQTDATCLDLGSELWFDDKDFYDICHTTPSGSAKIADYLFEKLKDKVQPAAPSGN